MTTVRRTSVRPRGTALAAALACALGLPAAASALSLGPVTVGEGSSPGKLPTVKVEVPVPGSKTPIGVGAGSEGVTVTTPVTPTTITVQTPATEVPKVEPPAKLEPPAPPKLEAPKTPGTPPVGVPPAGGVLGGGGSGASGSAGSSSSGGTANARHRAAAETASSTGALAARNGGRSGAGRGHGGRPRGGTPGGAGTPRTGGPLGSAPGPTGSATGPVGAVATAAKPTAHRPHGGSSDPLSSLGASLPLPLPVPDWSKPIILLLALLALAFAARWWRASRRATNLERRQLALLRDIEVMQAALVPEVPERLQALGVSVAYRPAEGPAAGGDFYDVFELGSDRVAVILGDVAGHGHDAVRRAALTRYTLRAFLKETGEPRIALALAGHALSEPGFEQLATVAIAVFDSSRGTLTYALAGHPPPLLLGVPAAEAPTQCSSPPVGCDLPTGRRQRTVSLPAGTRACLFSDGLPEARCGRSPAGQPELLGRERLGALLAALPEDAPARDLLAAVRSAASATPDDMAACILSSHATGARRAIDHEIVEVDARTVADGHLASYLRAGGVTETEAERVLRAARTQLKAHDTAVLIVDRSSGEAEVAVRPGREHSTGAGAPFAVPGRSRLTPA